MGSSPRVRGKLRVRIIDHGELRLIPACAGKTSTLYLRCILRRAHPRVCGENWATSLATCGMSGSSPRVRGKPQPYCREAQECRLIPACAGKTGKLVRPISHDRAHPRVCGENRVGKRGYGARRGSSPRVRGKPYSLTSGAFLNGLIPACAGKTKSQNCSRRAAWAHPRVCGENEGFSLDGVVDPGSSPRVRGKHGVVDPFEAGDGLIPACAGKTVPSACDTFSPSAHPRVCGENR